MRQGLLLSLFCGMACATTADAPISKSTVEQTPRESSYGSLSRKDLVSGRDIGFATASLQGNLSDRFPTARIVQCKDTLQLAVGVVGGNFVYAGDCVIADGDGRTYATICADEMVGYFALLESGLKPSGRDEIADWAYQNCGQGG